MTIRRLVTSLPRTRVFTSIAAFVFLLATGLPPAASEGADDDAVRFFNAKIQPVLVRECYECHSATTDEPKGELRLDSRDGWRAGGESGDAIVAGDPDASLLIEALRHESYEMPPDKKLSNEIIADFVKWIRVGAPDPRDKAPTAAEAEAMIGQLKAEELRDWWSLKSIAHPASPEVRDASWSDDPIDLFVLAKLEAVGLTPSPPADARTLIRRASIVLTGLPPTPEEIEAFEVESLRDPHSAFEDLVNRLLESPHFGERWAQHWLDALRWAETCGSESNIYRTRAWWLRDYVVQAFNDDEPYNQFIREQIAGDAYGVDAATGFLVTGPHVPPATVGREPTAIRQARFDRLDEVMQTLGASLFATTLGCARCHNHKFDAITMDDYYSLVAVFQDIDFGHRMPNLPKDHPRARRRAELMRRIEQLRDELRSADRGGWPENWVSHVQVHLPKTKAKLVRLTFLTGWASLDELEIYSPESHDNLAAATRGAKATSFNSEFISNKSPEYLLDGERTSFLGWAGRPKEKGKPFGVVIELPRVTTINRVDLSTDRETMVETDYIVQANRGKFSFSKYHIEISLDGERWIEVMSTEPRDDSPSDAEEQHQRLVNRINELAAVCYEEGPQAIFAGRFIQPKPTHVLHRGDPSRPGEVVKPAVFSIFDGQLDLDEDATGQQRRVAFADWVVSRHNPLTPRVTVNRFWHHVFGAGIAPTLDDFGHAAALPTHPELLDFLAADFVDDGWSTKRLLKRLVMTKTFRQSNAPRSKALKIDSSNRFLWRYRPRRVDAEVLRDSILAAAGTLDRTVGGKGYRIHADKKRYKQWIVVDNASPSTWRRLLYQERMRGIDDRMFTAFDLPDCKQVSSKRPVSTTPLQALNLLNGQLVLTQSAELAERVKREAGDDVGAQVERLFLLVLGRQPTDAERRLSTDAIEKDGLASLARVMINTNEFAFLN